MERLTGPRAWTINARVFGETGEDNHFDWLPMNDWRREWALRTGRVVEHRTLPTLECGLCGMDECPGTPVLFSV